MREPPGGRVTRTPGARRKNSTATYTDVHIILLRRRQKTYSSGIFRSLHIAHMQTSVMIKTLTIALIANAVSISILASTWTMYVSL